jgi:hypothetical protein
VVPQAVRIVFQTVFHVVHEFPGNRGKARTIISPGDLADSYLHRRGNAIFRYSVPRPYSNESSRQYEAFRQCTSL